MDSKKLALGLIAIGMAYGCSSVPTFTFPARDMQCASPSDGCTTDTPESTDEVRTVEVPETFPDRTLTYVLSTISLPEATMDPDGEGPQRAQAAGFNLDGIDSGAGSSEPDANCEASAQDFVSMTDSNHVGVDNAFQSLIGIIESQLNAADCPGMMKDGCLDATLQGQVESGSFLLMMQVSGVNDFTYDSSIMMQLYLAEVPMGGMPEVAAGGGLAGGQTFARTMTIGTAVPGDIFNGRLRVATPSLPLMIMAGGFNLNLDITQAQVRFNITESALSNGAIGGVVTIDAIVMAAEAFAPGMGMAIRNLITPFADVTPSSADAQVCDALSLGIVFDGVDATLTGI